ncbi:hypothetical protein FM104_14780 [Microbacterium esteraromaticum]|uniref:Uncharacterized protein n=1 Tax=Microbacterium esteraromaticum TaxID=57043 RepID=A0A1R4KQ98_9MICO|nr:hypothetical protein FM104_14780 [Microbacterium esteraromaticum]
MLGACVGDAQVAHAQEGCGSAQGASLSFRYPSNLAEPYLMCARGPRQRYREGRGAAGPVTRTGSLKKR